MATTTAVIPMSAEAEASLQPCCRTDHDGSLEAAVVGGKNEGVEDRFDVVRRYLVINPRGNPPAPQIRGDGSTVDQSKATFDFARVKSYRSCCYGAEGMFETMKRNALSGHGIFSVTTSLLCLEL
jgi:hypothetical protein